jgi:Phenazine biosynthesis-like protein
MSQYSPEEALDQHFLEKARALGVTHLRSGRAPLTRQRRCSRTASSPAARRWRRSTPSSATATSTLPLATCGPLATASTRSGRQGMRPTRGRRAAAAPGGYLRVLRRITAPTRLTVRQGEDLGRPGELLVDADPADERAKLTGRAVPIRQP